MPITTNVTSGWARALRAPVGGAFLGGAASVVEVVIDDHLVYSQHASVPLLHAALSHRVLSARHQGAGADRRGEISFTPGHRVRHGALERRRILGLEVAFADGFLEEACERRGVFDWRVVENGRDSKAFVLAQSLAEACRSAEDRLTGDMLMLALARRLGRVYGGADGRQDDGWLHPKALRRVLERLRTDPHQVSLGVLAQEAGLGVSAFVRGFRGAVGKTPMAFALECRLDQAAHALASTGLPISQIAAQTGFASASHLVQAFRGRHGLTPGRWRRARSDEPRTPPAWRPAL